MKLFQKYQSLNPKIRSVIFIAALIIVGILIGQIISQLGAPMLLESIERPNHPPGSPFSLTEDQKQGILEAYSRVSMILCAEIALLLGLIHVYVGTYSKTKSKYVIGFILFVSVFFIKSVSYFIAMTPLFSDSVRASPLSINPVLGGMFGPFGAYFTIFEILAICILIYLSRE